MRKNIDLLLEKLSQDSLAYQIVHRLSKSERQNWPEELDVFLKFILEEKKEELTHGKDQTP